MDPSTWGGFYFSSDSAYAYNLGVGFESKPHVFGRVWFPCLDEFIDRASYDCYITTKDSKMAVCGGMLQDTVNHGNGTITWHWEMTETIPTYLASVAVGSYTSVNGTFTGSLGNIPTFIYVIPADTTKAKNSFIHLNDALTGFESMFGPYRFSRVGYVAVPFNSGAMEHATNIAYPKVCINGLLSYETLYAHELLHMWFGDATTCYTAEDMWLNEGWGTYGETVFLEKVYSADAAKDYMRTKHKEVVQFCHIIDGGYRAVYGIPHNYTYGETVYEKGAVVAHTLRHYIGNCTFPTAIKYHLNKNAFKAVTTEDFRHSLEQSVAYDLSDFFTTWVYSPGFPHFSVDSFNVAQTNPDTMIHVFVKQKRNHLPAFANSNRVELTFMNRHWQKVIKQLNFSGEFGDSTYYTSFKPDFIMMDADEKIGDATSDCYKTLKSVSLYDYIDTYCKVDVKAISDSAFIRVEHNFVAPDPLKVEIPGLFLSDNRYWKIDGFKTPGMHAQPRFFYNKLLSMSDGYLDNVLMTNLIDSLRLMWRATPGDDWSFVNFTRTGNASAGYLIADSLRFGEYTLAIWDFDHIGIGEVIPNDKPSLNVYPNPSSDSFKISFAHNSNGYISFSNSSGQEVHRISINANQNEVIWKPANLPNDVYIARLVSKGEVQSACKIIYSR
jgi:aminopeptidase N